MHENGDCVLRCHICFYYAKFQSLEDVDVCCVGRERKEKKVFLLTRTCDVCSPPPIHSHVVIGGTWVALCLLSYVDHGLVLVI